MGSIWVLYFVKVPGILAEWQCRGWIKDGSLPLFMANSTKALWYCRWDRNSIIILVWNHIIIPSNIVGKAMHAKANVIISTLLGLNLFKFTLEIRLNNDWKKNTELIEFNMDFFWFYSLFRNWITFLLFFRCKLKIAFFCCIDVLLR